MRDPSKVRFRGVLAAIPLVLVAGSAAAQPPAPAGWSRERRGAITVYVPREGQEIELRLFPDATASRSLQPWFEARLSTAPADVDFAGYAGSQEMQDGAVRVAMGTGKARGSAVVVVALACQKPDASKVFAELIVPQDEETLKRYVPAATELVVLRCFQGGGGSAAPPAAEPAAKPRPAARKEPEFKYLARNGRGVSRSQMEGVLQWWEQVYLYTGLTLREGAYLLLKNGRARKVPPVPPEDFDFAAEMSAEPDKWGSWKKQGGQYVVKFPDDKSYSAPPHQRIGKPGRANQRLDGSYTTSSSASIGQVSSWSTSYLRFTRDGRFSHSTYGGTGGTIGDTTAVTRWDDEGSASSVTGPSFGGGGERRRASNEADRQGRYRIDGYALELHYDSGRLERRFFFSTSESLIWFGDGMYLREDKKK